ncbi:hypothetical protein FF1_009666 [Malus domestica]
MALPNFAMSCFKLPIGVYRDAGGLGFKDIQCFNLAFLAKIGWRLIQNPTSLLATVLRDKYFPGKVFKDAGRGRNTSSGWKGIYEGRMVLQHCVRWRVGDEESINIRNDPWLPTPTTFLANPKDSLEEIMVRDLIEPVSKSWKEEVISAGFNWDEARQILSIALSKSSCYDRIVWHYTVNGDYSVKTGFPTKLNSSSGSVAIMLYHRFWFGSPIHINSRELAGADFLESWDKICTRIKNTKKNEEIL